MVIGTGIDIVNMDRIERMIARWGDFFLGRVFTEKEIGWCQRRTRPPECFATRFAAKEAFLKAIGWGLRHGIQWVDIEVVNDSMGKPSFCFHQKAKEVFNTLHIKKALLTLSHDRPYAVAHVLLEDGNDESSDC
ncbi:MAG: holo-ACP synthase [Syntrophaceae bacterium]|nr:holo-ACP synthase [Syntrophaceae bacterium]